MVPPPHRSEVNASVLRRVRALLAKAESTEFAEEAAALTAKANQLMATHAISAAMAEADSNSARGQVINVQIIIEAPYGKEKLRLLAAVAAPNRCRTVMGIGGEALQEMMANPDTQKQLDEAGAIATVFGYQSDIEIVQLLYTSLLVQAVSTMFGHGTVVDTEGVNRTRSFRHSFLVGFASTVTERLAEANQEAVEEAQKADGVTTGAVVPLLAARQEQVDQAMADMFPNLGRMRTTVSNHAGLAAGESAGALADIGASKIGSQGPAIGRHSSQVGS